MWLDALTNYLTVLGYPQVDESHLAHNVRNTTHVIGKDIAKFHCSYYPMFLLAAGHPLPERVLSHGHWLKDNQKMSKSLGNVTCPFKLLNRYGQDSVRTYFLAEGPQNKDCNFEENKLLEINNSFLANSFANMLSRISGKKILKNLPE